MRSFFKRLFCFHLNWTKGRTFTGTPHYDDYVVIMGKGRIIPWTCAKCGKTKQFSESSPPIQYIGGR